MATRSPYLLGSSTDEMVDQLNRPIPKVLRLDQTPDQETPRMSYVSPQIKSEWPSVSSKSKKALPAREYQFYYGDSKPLTERNNKRIIRVSMERSCLGAWARGADGQQ